jgi:hypothetical protein
MNPVIASACDEAITSACRREAALNREWFEKAGVPKAIRVAQRETFDVLRAHGVISKNARNSGDVSRQCAIAEGGREEKKERRDLAASLAEVNKTILQAAANYAALANATLQRACLAAGEELGRLRDHLASDERLDLQELASKLEEIERELANTLWRATPAADLEIRLRSARAELRDYETRMGKEVFDETVRRRVTAGLRELHGIPRISLFYL